MSTRDLARLFSSRVIADLANPHSHVAAGRVEAIGGLNLSEGPDATLGELFDSAHSRLSRDYRSEYLYKNALVSRIIFGRHRPTTASALIEVPVGASVLDVAIFNGTSTAYEIKTDLDSFARLDKQLNDYATCFEQVNVVTSIERAGTAAALAPEHVGVIGLRRNGSLATIRKSSAGLTRLRLIDMFQMLRQGEALAVLRKTLDYEVDVAAGDLWLRSRDLFTSLPVDVAHYAYVEQLRLRGMRGGAVAADSRFPSSLRAAAYEAELSSSGQTRLKARLLAAAPNGG